MMLSRGNFPEICSKLSRSPPWPAQTQLAPLVPSEEALGVMLLFFQGIFPQQIHCNLVNSSLRSTTEPQQAASALGAHSTSILTIHGHPVMGRGRQASSWPGHPQILLGKPSRQLARVIWLLYQESCFQFPCSVSDWVMCMWKLKSVSLKGECWIQWIKKTRYMESAVIIQSGNIMYTVQHRDSCCCK